MPATTARMSVVGVGREACAYALDWKKMIITMLAVTILRRSCETMAQRVLARRLKMVKHVVHISLSDP